MVRRAQQFTKRPEQGHQQIVLCYVDTAGSYDGEEHDVGEFIYLDEIHAHALQRKRKVRICTYEEARAVRKADERMRPQGLTALSPIMDL